MKRWTLRNRTVTLRYNHARMFWAVRMVEFRKSSFIGVQHIFRDRLTASKVARSFLENTK